MKRYMLVLISVLLLFVISASPVMAETLRPDVDVQPGHSVSVMVQTPSGHVLNIVVVIEINGKEI